MAEHRHGAIPVQPFRDGIHPLGGTAQREMHDGMGQSCQLEFRILAHVHQLDRLATLQPLLQVVGADLFGLAHGRRGSGGGGRMDPS